VKIVTVPQHCLHLSFFSALSLMAELGGYLGLFLGYSLMQISGPLTSLWIQVRYVILQKVLIEAL
jgi:hypothetical protein